MEDAPRGGVAEASSDSESDPDEGAGAEEADVACLDLLEPLLEAFEAPLAPPDPAPLAGDEGEEEPPLPPPEDSPLGAPVEVPDLVRAGAAGGRGQRRRRFGGDVKVDTAFYRIIFPRAMAIPSDLLLPCSIQMHFVKAQHICWRRFIIFSRACSHSPAGLVDGMAGAWGWA